MNPFLENLLSTDRALFTLINQSWSQPFLDSVLPFLTDAHKNPIVIVLVILALIGAFIRNRKKTAVALFLCALSFAATDSISHRIIKPLFARQRPEFTMPQVILRSPSHKGLSFPSNHAANMFAVATILTLFIKRFWYLYYFVAFIIAYSRVYVGVHFPLDVTAGALVGILVSLFLWQLLKWLNLPYLQLYPQNKGTDR